MERRKVDMLVMIYALVVAQAVDTTATGTGITTIVKIVRTARIIVISVVVMVVAVGLAKRSPTDMAIMPKQIKKSTNKHYKMTVSIVVQTTGGITTNITRAVKVHIVTACKTTMVTGALDDEIGTFTRPVIKTAAVIKVHTTEAHMTNPVIAGITSRTPILTRMAADNTGTAPADITMTSSTEKATRLPFMTKGTL